MAAIIKYRGNQRRIEFTGHDGKRRRLWLGKITGKQAESIRSKVEEILKDQFMNRPHSSELASWIGGLNEIFLGRMQAVGLAEGAVGTVQTTLGQFMERFFSTMTCKNSTRTFYGHTRRNLEKFFGKTRMLRDISAVDADQFRAWLIEDKKELSARQIYEGKKPSKMADDNSVKLSPATVARRIIAARTFWKMAIRWRLATDNPFSGIKAGVQENDSRKQFIPRDVIEKAMAEAPDVEWKLIIALARYGGLRTPSETFGLRWTDVNFERGTIVVNSPKTAHHAGHGSRTIPLFVELRGLLLEAFTETEPGSEYVISRHRLPCANLRTEFNRILTRAGLTSWERLFQNLRASCESELLERFSLSTCCKWLGHSPSVAARHYLTSIDLDRDFKRAAGLDSAHHFAHHPTAETRGNERTGAKDDMQESPENIDRPLVAALDSCGEWAIKDRSFLQIAK